MGSATMPASDPYHEVHNMYMYKKRSLPPVEGTLKLLWPDLVLLGQFCQPSFHVILLIQNRFIKCLMQREVRSVKLAIDSLHPGRKQDSCLTSLQRRHGSGTLKLQELTPRPPEQDELCPTPSQEM